MTPASCPHWELDLHQIFPWVRVCKHFIGCSGCRLEGVEVCRWQGLRTVATGDEDRVLPIYA